VTIIGNDLNSSANSGLSGATITGNGLNSSFDSGKNKTSYFYKL